ncbi:Osiris 22 [Carabus blaptoides fortunei]
MNNYDSKKEHSGTDKAISKKLTHFPDTLQRLITHSSRERKKQKDMFQRLLPMFIIPYLVQSAILPMILMAMKAMLVKSLLIGKLALILVAINAFRSQMNAAQSHESTNLVHEHYGFNGNEEFGAYVNSGH